MQPDSLPPEVVQALKLGRPVEAIKRLRKATGLGLAEAKSIIDAFSSGNTAYQSPGATAQKQKKQRAQMDSSPPPVPDSAHRHEYVPPPTQAPLERSGLGPGEVTNSNSSFWLVLFLLIVAAVGYYVL